MPLNKSHALLYFKIDKNLGFIFDPNIGLIKLAGNKQCEAFANKLLVSAHILSSMDDDSYFEFQQLVQRDEATPTHTTYTISVEQ